MYKVRPDLVIPRKIYNTIYIEWYYIFWQGRTMWERPQVQAVLRKINSETQVNKGKTEFFSIT